MKDEGKAKADKAVPMKSGAAFAAALLGLSLLFSPPATCAEGKKGAVDMSVTIAGGLTLVSGTLVVGEVELPLEAGKTSYLIEGVEVGSQLVAADGKAGTGVRLLGLTDVNVRGGKTAKATLSLAAVKDVNAYCSGCHPAPGEPAGIRDRVRDVHRDGDCEDCHTPHRPTEHTKYAVAPFRDSNDLCVKCHDAGHGLRTAEICMNCHALSRHEVEKGTAYISSAARTLPSIKIVGSRKVPDSFGCTFCHSNDLSREAMRGVLTHFGAQASKHPVGVNFKTVADTPGEYLSTWDSSTSDELDCIDCHDSRLLVDPSKENQATSAPYANHVDPSTMERAGNPFMLKDADPSALCLSCHGKGEKFDKADAVLKGHGEKDLAEDDGTPLKTSACLDCHDAHYSNKAKLFSDGHEGDSPVEIKAADGCTTLCHQRGDAGGVYDTSGHGKAKSISGKPMGMNCGTCHGVNNRHEGPLPKLLTFREDGEKSHYGTSATSLCTACHQEYVPHGGKKIAGCLDCHGTHGEGTAGNVAMVLARLPQGADKSEKTVHEMPGTGGYSYYRADGAGVCDNAACHAGIKSADGTAAVPLSTLMQGGHHGGGDQLTGANCRSCHPHDSRQPKSSWHGGKSR